MTEATDPPEFIPLSRLPDFDPQRVPVVGVDAHLPAVPPAVLTAPALRQRFAQPPAWEPELRGEPRFTNRAIAHASVLVPIVMREQPMLLLTERTAHLSTHSGQVAFPGGKADEDDDDVAHTALREAEEEIGLASSRVEVIGHLPTYTTGTRFVVTPVVALVHPPFELAINPFEVAAAFEIPLAWLMDPAHHRRHVLEVQGAQRQWFSMPYDDAGTVRFVWGATAGMLRNLYRFLSA